jgi:hypothetical protein
MCGPDIAFKHYAKEIHPLQDLNLSIEYIKSL